MRDNLVSLWPVGEPLQGQGDEEDRVAADSIMRADDYDLGPSPGYILEEESDWVVSAQASHLQKGKLLGLQLPGAPI